MRRQHTIHSLVYHQLFPSPSPSDPPDFSTHLVRNLITEVRIETQRFYGGLETTEAKYPGLNYAHPPHRKRLSRFPHHARLFRAFDQLSLTEYEIGILCRWEGTLWARQRYERDEGIVVQDTTGNEIRPWVDRRGFRGGKGRVGMGGTGSRKGIKVKTDIEVEIEEVVGSGSNDRRNRHLAASAMSRSVNDENTRPMASTSEPESDEATDEEMESVGIELDRRLIAATTTTRDQRPHADTIVDPAYEQYLKEAAEAGILRRPSVTASSSNSPPPPEHA